MITYITADPHLSRDEDGWSLGRPFDNAKDMSLHIVDQFNRRMTRNDRLIIVGDFSMKEPAYFRQKIVCRNSWLVLGNHDKRRLCELAFGFRNIRQQYETKLCGQWTYFSHYPTMYWPKSHHGSFHCFGHVHDNRTDTINSLFPDMRAMDVGVDAAKRVLGEYTCFSEQEVHDMLISKPGHDPVEWYKHHRGEY